MVERDQGEGAEGPENQGVGEAGQWTLANDFGLKKNFPDELANAGTDGEEVKIGVLFRGANPREHDGKAAPEEGN